MKKHRNQIKGLRSTKKINPREYFLLFPKDSNETFSAEFDSSLLHTLLSLFCGLVKPDKGWKAAPEDTDNSKGANLIRLSIGRNEIQHAPPYVSNIVYKKISKDMIKAMTELGVNSEEFQNLLPHTKYDLFPPVKNFYGRDEEVANIHTMVRGSDNNILNLVIHGLTGIGKSEIVRQYCHLHSKYFSENILWINAETNISLEGSFRSIAEIIKLNLKDMNGDYKNPETIVHDVHNYFANDKILYVFDNAMDMHSIIKFLPRYKPSVTIITSQCSNWGLEFETMYIEQFNDNTSKMFLTNNLIKELSEKEIDDVLSLLDGHPLALQQVISFIDKTNIDPSKYIKILKSKAAKILSKPINTKFKSISAITTIKTTVNTLLSQMECSLSMDLLNIMAHLNGKKINMQFLINAYPTLDEYEIDDALNIIKDYSLIKMFKLNGEIIILIHSLVQIAVSEQQECEETTDRYLETVLKTIFKRDDGKLIEQFSDFDKNCYEHFIFLFQNNKENKVLIRIFTEEVEFISQQLMRKGKLNELVQITSALLQFNLQRLGCNHPDILTLKCYLAISLKEKGNIDEALVLFKALEKSANEVLGSKHFVTVTSEDYLAECLKGKGYLDEALNLSKALGKRRTKFLGADHPDTLTSKNNLAQCLKEKGRLDEALVLFKALEKSFTEVLGSNHHKTIILKNNLALSLLEKGHLDEALVLFKDLKKSYTEVMGSNHPKTLVLNLNLAGCLKQKGQLNEALVLFKALEKSFTEVLGPNHPNTLTMKMNLAGCLQEKGDLDEALGIFKELKKSFTKVLGSDHVDTLTLKTNLAKCLHEKGHFDESLVLSKALEKSFTKALGSNHPKTLRLKINLAVCLLGKGNIDEALVRFKALEKSVTEVLGQNHPDTLTLKGNLAICLYQTGHLDEALVLFKTLEKSCTEVLGSNHPKTLTLKTELVGCLQEKGHLDEALVLLRALEKSFTEVNHPHTFLLKMWLVDLLLGKGYIIEAFLIASAIVPFLKEKF